MANLRIWMAASLIAVGAWAAGPQAATTRPRSAATVTPKRVTVQPKLSDVQLEAVIRAKFAKSKISTDKFTVRVQGGVATIDGKTDETLARGPDHLPGIRSQCANATPDGSIC